MHLIQIKWNEMTRLLVFLVWLNSINRNAIHGLGCCTKTCFLLLVLLRPILSWNYFSRMKRSLKGLPGQTECLWFQVLKKSHKRTVMMTHSSRTFRPNLLRQHHRNESSNYPNHRCRGRRDSQLALKHVFLIIEKRSDKRERKESKPFVCWCSRQKYMQLWFTKLENIVMKLYTFVCARFVHGTFHFCTISIVIEVRLTSSQRTPSERVR